MRCPPMTREEWRESMTDWHVTQAANRYAAIRELAVMMRELIVSMAADLHRQPLAPPGWDWEDLESYLRDLRDYTVPDMEADMTRKLEDEDDDI